MAGAAQRPQSLASSGVRGVAQALRRYLDHGSCLRILRPGRRYVAAEPALRLGVAFGEFGF